MNWVGAVLIPLGSTELSKGWEQKAGTQCWRCSKSKNLTVSFCSYNFWCQSGVRTMVGQWALVKTMVGQWALERKAWWANEPWMEDHGGPVSPGVKTMVGQWAQDGRPWWASEPWGKDHGGLFNFIKSYFAHPHDTMIVSCFFFINFIWRFHTDICIIITLSPTLLLPPSYPYLKFPMKKIRCDSKVDNQ